MSLNRKELKKVLSNTKFKSDAKNQKEHDLLIENLVESLSQERDKEFLIFFNSILKNNKEAFESSLNFIAKNKNKLNISVDGESKKAINVSKTLISSVKSKRDLELLSVAVKSGFFDFKNKDFYTSKSIDLIKEHGTKELLELVNNNKKNKKRKKVARI